MSVSLLSLPEAAATSKAAASPDVVQFTCTPHHQCRPFVNPVRGELQLYPLSSFAACSSALSEAADPSNL